MTSNVMTCKNCATFFCFISSSQLPTFYIVVGFAMDFTHLGMDYREIVVQKTSHIWIRTSQTGLGVWSKVEWLDQVWVQFFSSQELAVWIYKKIFVSDMKGPSLVRTNSVQMMQPYLPWALTLPGWCWILRWASHACAMIGTKMKVDLEE